MISENRECQPQFERGKWDQQYNYNNRGNLEIEGTISCAGCSFSKAIKVETAGHEAEERLVHSMRDIVLDRAMNCDSFRSRFASTQEQIIQSVMQPLRIFDESRNQQTPLS